MNPIDDCYVMVRYDPAFWLVEGGERVLMKDPADVRAHGLKRVIAVDIKELEAIPVKGERRKSPKVSDES